MDFKTFFLNTATLLIVLDPVGIIPIVQSLLLPVPRKRRMHVLRRELCIVLALLLMFYFAGEAILNYMEIDQSTLSISGGILLLLIAVGMVFPRVDVLGPTPEHDSKNSEPLLVPIAVPIIVGPASISVVMIMAAKCTDTPALLIGGGVGVPPMFMAARKLREAEKPVTVILGFNTAEEVFFEEEFRALGCEVKVTTVDGSKGIKGFVTDAMESGYTHFITCGPEPMLKAVYKKSETSGQFSFEERMGCGFGACMGCSCKTKYGTKRICKDGPVLYREEIIW